MAYGRLGIYSCGPSGRHQARSPTPLNCATAEPKPWRGRRHTICLAPRRGEARRCPRSRAHAKDRPCILSVLARPISDRGQRCRNRSEDSPTTPQSHPRAKSPASLALRDVEARLSSASSEGRGEKGGGPAKLQLSRPPVAQSSKSTSQESTPVAEPTRYRQSGSMSAAEGRGGERRRPRLTKSFAHGSIPCVPDLPDFNVAAFGRHRA